MADPQALVRPLNGRPKVWEPLLAPLKDRPGEWVQIRTYRRLKAVYQATWDLRSATRRPRTTVVPPGRWEFRSRQITPDVAGWALDARYLGPQIEAAHDHKETAA